MVSEERKNTWVKEGLNFVMHRAGDARCDQGGRDSDEAVGRKQEDGNGHSSLLSGNSGPGRASCSFLHFRERFDPSATNSPLLRHS